MILDVGCGSRPMGDINCDIEIQDTSKMFVLCDAQYLPFRSNSFSFVYSSHVVEHISNHILMIKELLRVTSNLLLIKTPYLFSYSSRGLPIISRLTGFTYHLHSWTRNFWRKLLCNYEISIKVEPRLNVPFWYIPFKSIQMLIEVKK